MVVYVVLICINSPLQFFKGDTERVMMMAPPFDFWGYALTHFFIVK